MKYIYLFHKTYLNIKVQTKLFVFMSQCPYFLIIIILIVFLKPSYIHKTAVR